MKMRLFFGTNGSVQGVYNDVILKMVPGRHTITRESNVEFNVNLQRWEATDLSGNLMTHATTREACLQQEHAIVEQRIAERHRHPNGIAGLEKAKTIQNE